MDRHRELTSRRAAMQLGGGEKAIEKQHAKGKNTARERLNMLFDRNTFHELGGYVHHRCMDFGMQSKVLPGDGVVCGHGKIDGRTVFAYAQDFTLMGGSMGEEQANKICRVIEMAMEAGAPVVGLNDSGGARIQEGVNALSGYGKIFYMNTRASGVIPQITAILGPCAGGAVYSPALTDFVCVVKNTSRMFITGPDVIRAATGEQTTPEELGGAQTHSTVSGNAHFCAETEADCLKRIRQLLSYLPSSFQKPVPHAAFRAERNALRPRLDSLLPESRNRTYDMHLALTEIADGEEIMEYMEGFASNVITAFARIGGAVVGIVANQPRRQAGCLDVDASDKAARFVRTCDAFGIPLVTLVDVPGFLPGVRQEYAGIIRHGAKMLYAYSEATVPKITVILRKAYGGAYLAMCSKNLGADLVYAWDSAEIGVMGEDGAANILMRDETDAAAREAWKANYRAAFLNPYRAAERGQIDDVILPSETRARILEALELLRDKPRAGVAKHHGNMPL